MSDIVVLGIFNADTAYHADRLPRLGETILGSGFVLGPGGKGSNQAVAAAKAGGDVTIVTRLGADAFADLGRATWAEAGVKSAVTVDAESHTGAAFIFLQNGTGENAIIVASGAAGRADRRGEGVHHPVGTAHPRRPPRLGNRAGRGRADHPEPGPRRRA